MKSWKSCSRRGALATIAAAAALTASITTTANANPTSTWPQKPVRIVVPFPAGGTGDLIARALGNNLREMWGQPVLIENRGGANGTIGTAHVARAEPDGHTLILAAASHIMNPPLFPKLTYDAVKSFTPIMRLGSYPMAVVVNASTPYKTLADLTAALKADPGSVSVASTGPGSAPHLAAALFEQGVGGKFTHVPYQGSGPMMMAILSGQVNASFHGATIWDQVRAGKVRALAITGDKRLAEHPTVPTIAELGHPGYNVLVWYGMLAPAGMDPALRDRLYRDIRKAMESEAVAAPMKTAGIFAEDMNPEQFKASLEREAVQWRKVIQDAGIKPE